MEAPTEVLAHTNQWQKSVSLLTCFKNASEEFGLEVNAGETKYVFMSHHQSAVQNLFLNTTNKFFENVADLKYLVTTVINQDYICQEIKK
jgi:hypothetical protein